MLYLSGNLVYLLHVVSVASVRKPLKGNTVKLVLRGHLWYKEKVALFIRHVPVKRGWIYMKFTTTGQEKVAF